jgi:hypothetical protein
MMAGPRRLRLMVGRALDIMAVFSPFHPDHTGRDRVCRAFCPENLAE